MRAMKLTVTMVVTAAVVGSTVGCQDGVNVDITAPGPDDDLPNPTTQNWEWRGFVEPRDAIEIKGVMGDIRASPTMGRDVEVFATKSGERSDPFEVRMDVIRHSGGVTICAVYPAPARKPRNECQPGDAGVVNTQDNDVVVTFTVLVPQGVAFIGKTIVGDVTADSLSNDAFAGSITGNVYVRTVGVAEASTITGSVTAYLGSADWNRDLDFSTVTGSIFVEIPATTNAYVRASTLNGNIVVDFQLQETGVGRREGTIGTGGPDLTLSTINGNITLRSGQRRN